MTTPCPTCRHYVIHLATLGSTIASLRIAATRRHGLHGRLMRHVHVGRRIKVKYARHLKEHRATIRDLAEHLTEHADGRAVT